MKLSQLIHENHGVWITIVTHNTIDLYYVVTKEVIILAGEDEIISIVKFPINDDENVVNATLSLSDAMNDPKMTVTVNIAEDPETDEGISILVHTKIECSH